jgi:hypothetical protein
MTLDAAYFSCSTAVYLDREALVAMLAAVDRAEVIRVS